LFIINVGWGTVFRPPTIISHIFFVTILKVKGLTKSILNSLQIFESIVTPSTIDIRASTTSHKLN
jgi:hypothetical protein